MQNLKQSVIYSIKANHVQINADGMNIVIRRKRKNDKHSMCNMYHSFNDIFCYGIWKDGIMLHISIPFLIGVIMGYTLSELLRELFNL